MNVTYSSIKARQITYTYNIQDMVSGVKRNVVRTFLAATNTKMLNQTTSSVQPTAIKYLYGYSKTSPYVFDDSENVVPLSVNEQIIGPIAVTDTVAPYGFQLAVADIAAALNNDPNYDPALAPPAPVVLPPTIFEPPLTPQNPEIDGLKVLFQTLRGMLRWGGQIGSRIAPYVFLLTLEGDNPRVWRKATAEEKDKNNWRIWNCASRLHYMQTLLSPTGQITSVINTVYSMFNDTGVDIADRPALVSGPVVFAGLPTPTDPTYNVKGRHYRRQSWYSTVDANGNIVLPDLSQPSVSDTGWSTDGSEYLESEQLGNSLEIQKNDAATGGWTVESWHRQRYFALQGTTDTDLTVSVRFEGIGWPYKVPRTMGGEYESPFVISNDVRYKACTPFMRVDMKGVTQNNIITAYAVDYVREF